MRLRATVTPTVGALCPFDKVRFTSPAIDNASAFGKFVLQPIFEADFEDNAYGYRPARGAVGTAENVHRHICRGYTDVVDADLSRYFDSIPHDDLLKSVACRVADDVPPSTYAMANRKTIIEIDEHMFAGKRAVTCSVAAIFAVSSTFHAA
jgi:hypothetical protein